MPIKASSAARVTPCPCPTFAAIPVRLVFIPTPASCHSLLLFPSFFFHVSGADDAVVHYLVEDLWVDVDAATVRGMTALHYAAKVYQVHTSADPNEAIPII